MKYYQNAPARGALSPVYRDFAATLEGTGTVEPVDKYRLDRVPTRGERWLGIVLSGLLAVVFLTSAAFVLTKLPTAGADRRGVIIGAAILAAIGLIAVFLLYRIAFTRPEAASPRANRTLATVMGAVAALAVVGTLVFPAQRAHLAGSLLGFFFIALGVLSRVRKSKGGKASRRVVPRADKSLDQARDQ